MTRQKQIPLFAPDTHGDVKRHDLRRGLGAAAAPGEGRVAEAQPRAGAAAEGRRRILRRPDRALRARRARAWRVSLRAWEGQALQEIGLISVIFDLSKLPPKISGRFFVDVIMCSSFGVPGRDCASATMGATSFGWDLAQHFANACGLMGFACGETSDQGAIRPSPRLRPRGLEADCHTLSNLLRKARV